MKTVTERDLRHDFKKVERILNEGAEVQVTKRNLVIAKLTPAPKPSVNRPDFLGRMRTVYGEQNLPVSGAAVLRSD